MKGVILEIVPEAQIVDISHAVQPFDVLDGALTISQAYSYFPSSTVHLVVVDPGVGTARRPIIAISDKYYFVAPDNGVLSLVYAQEERMHVRHISSDHYFLQPISNTFHARDIFAPVAAISPSRSIRTSSGTRSRISPASRRPSPKSWTRTACAP